MPIFFPFLFPHFVVSYRQRLPDARKQGRACAKKQGASYARKQELPHARHAKRAVMDSKTITMPNELAENLKVAEEDASARFDASAKKLIAEKSILAYILKSSLTEYTPYTVQEKFIEGEPEIATLAVHQDHPNRKRINGLPTEDKSQREGTVYFDIRFKAIVPQSGELMQIFVNCEIQNNDTPGYPIPKRGIYYAARMISSQRGKVFKDQEYGKISKAVSIWLCEDTADSRSDTINRYAFAEECLRGDYHEQKENYDLMSVVVMRLGRKGENSADDAIRLLSKLFSTELGYEKKLGTLQDEFHISVTKEINKEVLDVCNLSTGVLKKGEMQKAKEMAISLNELGVSVDKIATAAKVSVATVQKWLSEPQMTPTK